MNAQARIRYIPQHTDGHFITVRCERTTDYTAAVRFNHEADLLTFLNGQFGPEQPESFSVVRLKISYELEVGEDVQNERIDNQFSDSHSSV